MCVFLDAKFAGSFILWFKLTLYTQTDALTHIFTNTNNNGRTSTPTMQKNERPSEWASEQKSHLYAHRTFYNRSTLMESTMENNNNKKKK